MTKIYDLRTEFLFEILGRQTKVAQRLKHAIPCHAFRSEKSTMCLWKRQWAGFLQLIEEEALLIFRWINLM